jgi:CxxC motif-containing protein
MNTVREVICIQCPFACRIKVEVAENGILSSVNGYKCARGEAYAKQEVLNPVRILTTTVKIRNTDQEHPLLAVQTDRPIPREMLAEAMRELAKITLTPPIKYKDVIIADLLGTGANVIANSEVGE